MSTIDYTNVRTIKIAPDYDEITVTDNEICTDYAHGIRYIAEGLDRYSERYLKEMFRACIAMLSKRWQIEECMNRNLGLSGKIE